jgi:hypothetical protein
MPKTELKVAPELSKEEGMDIMFTMFQEQEDEVALKDLQDDQSDEEAPLLSIEHFLSFLG